MSIPAFANLSQNDMQTFDRIKKIKLALGPRLLLLAHHYQRPEIVALGDFRGDSYELSLKASQSEAEWIVFCGVHFMAQSAAVLARPEQKVFHPNPQAGCPMAEMIDRGQLRRAFADLAQNQRNKKIIPITYMNALVDVKAEVGERGGCVCTSSNADRAFNWAYARADTVLFVPDQHLGHNTAFKLGIPEEEIAVYDPAAGALGGLTELQLQRAKLLLWNGYCHVHTWFTTDHIKAARERWPGCQVHVHPECPREVVAAADGSGSTTYLVNVVETAPTHSDLVIGTEVNLVRRLAMEHLDKNIYALDRSLCPNMYRITLSNVLQTLEQLPGVNEISVADADRAGAVLALKRMLEI